MHNLENVIRAVDIMADNLGLRIGVKKVCFPAATLSPTTGLCISIHSTSFSRRRAIGGSVRAGRKQMDPNRGQGAKASCQQIITALVNTGFFIFSRVCQSFPK